MLPAIYNPTIKQGVPFHRQLIITDGSGSAIDLTGATAVGQIKSADGFQVLAGFTFQIAEPLAGKIDWLLSDTTVLPPTDGRAMLPYDVFIAPADGARICPVEGLIAVEAARTKLT